MRYVVVGTSGAGKSTFARRLAAATRAAYVELDALHWGPHWTERPDPEFAASVREATLGERWVADGNYSAVREVLWPRATHVVWLDFGRALVFARVLRRTLSRALRRESLWHGNRESLRRAFLARDSILLWSLTTYGKNRRKYDALRASGDYRHVQWARLRTPREAEAFLARHRLAD